MLHKARTDTTRTWTFMDLDLCGPSDTLISI